MPYEPPFTARLERTFPEKQPEPEEAPKAATPPPKKAAPPPPPEPEPEPKKALDEGWVEEVEVEEAEKAPFPHWNKNWSKARLLTLAEELDLDVTEDSYKSEIVKAFREAEKAHNA